MTILKVLIRVKTTNLNAIPNYVFNWNSVIVKILLINSTVIFLEVRFVHKSSDKRINMERYFSTDLYD